MSTNKDYTSLIIRQLDGTALRHKFRSIACDSLADVCSWIDESRTDGDTPYRLMTQYPQHDFDITEEQYTLCQLKLHPSATFIMKPVNNMTEAYSSMSTTNWMNYVSVITNNVSQSVTKISNFIIPPVPAPEHGRRLGTNTNNTE
ncbi:hypothetical protein BDB01DRAFT_519219 [Pilobolus umbonatus]|nr:hypothetical protein BDB01DRAFT_519219 [Pilobolus umbonatus]